MSAIPSFWRGIIVAVFTLGCLSVWYPAAFVVQHGFDSSAWDDRLLLPAQWFHDLASHQVLPCIGVYVAMVQGKQIAFADGGLTAMIVLAATVLGGGTYFVVKGGPIPGRCGGVKPGQWRPAA